MSAIDPLAGHTLFIADLHLDPARQTAYQLALTFFEQARGASALYILGDLFEYWVGDDAGIPIYADVIDALQALVTSGVRLSVMLGNRDFLLGNDFAAATGARLISDDEHTVSINAQQILLMHGDTLCVDDLAYQQFRTSVRDPAWQQRFLARSIDDRMSYARQLRAQSKVLSDGKQQDIMDVNNDAVLERMRANRVHCLVHGHTHRPGIHSHADNDLLRLVVGDWHEQHARIGVCDAKGAHLRTFDGQLN